MLVKVAPAYDGGYYTLLATPVGTACNVTLNYSGGAGTWSISRSASGSWFPGGAESGTWTTTPATSYERRIVAMSISGTTAGTVIYTPASAPTSWTSAGGTVCRIAISSGTAYGSLTYYIEVRKVGTTTPVLMSSIGLGLDNR